MDCSATVSLSEFQRSPVYQLPTQYLHYFPINRVATLLIPDPITLHVVVGSCPVIAFEQLDQGSVAPTSQSQRYYDKILTILSDPRTLAPLVRLSGTYQGSGISSGRW